MKDKSFIPHEYAYSSLLIQAVLTSIVMKCDNNVMMEQCNDWQLNIIRRARPIFAGTDTEELSDQDLILSTHLNVFNVYPYPRVVPW